MDPGDPVLFDLAGDPPATSAPRPSGGRARERWTCRVSAHVEIVDSARLDEAMSRAEKDGLVIELGRDEGGDAATLESDGRAVTEASDDLGGLTIAGFDRVGWLLWPTDGLDPVLAAGALEVREVATELVVESGVAGTVTWSTTVVLRDVAALRRIAVTAHPDEATAIAASLAAAWRCAVDLFAPVRAIPGITWDPGPVEFHHVPARDRRGR